MTLLAFARGPALTFALVVFILGIAWRIYAIYRRPARPELSAPRARGGAGAAARAIATALWPPASLRKRTLPNVVAAWAYHLGLAIVFFGFVPHIAFVQRLTGLTWPALPGPVFAAGVALSFVGLLYALMARLTSPVLRLLSGFDDYASWAVTFLPLVTGMAALSRSLGQSYPFVPDQPVVVAVHLLSVELLLVWLPFSKLSHAFIAFLARGSTGAAFARKGAAL